MGKLHGKDGIVKISANAVAEVSSWNLETSSNQAEGSAMGDNFTTNKAGIKSQSGTIECNYEESDANGQDLLVEGDTVDLNLFPKADETGTKFWGGNALITQSSVSDPKDGIVSVTFQFVNADSDGITRQTVA